MKPILFNTEMVRAILDGRKTVTRRVVNRDIINGCDIDVDGTLLKYENCYGDFIEPIKLCKHKAGDVLYVRETWRVGAWNENGGLIAVDYLADGHSPKDWIQVDSEAFEKYWVQSTNDAIAAGIKPDEDVVYHWERGKGPTRWRPSIHMPKEAARIFLKVTHVRIERLHEITEDQAEREGVLYEPATGELGARKLFQTLWNSTINKSELDRFGWDANPWVWVIEFERCEKPESEDK